MTLLLVALCICAVIYLAWIAVIVIEDQLSRRRRR